MAETPNVAPGAQAPATKPTTVNIKSIRGNGDSKDLRVRIRVPADYLTATTQGGAGQILKKLGGIIFPYTPTVNYDVKADYANTQPMHSNYTQYFYQRSSIGAINITGKFTVQNDTDAVVYLSTIQLLKSLTKMKFGDEVFSGSPPPVCRLMGYGPFMLENVPVAVASFRIDLPSEVDYFTLGKQNPDPTYGTTSVPTMSSLSVICYPMYSRNEQQQFTTSKWLSQDYKSDFRKKGYL